METITVFTLITILGVVSVFPLTSLTGLFSFGQGAYIAIGAYTAGLMAIHLHMTLVPCIISGLLVSGIIALIVGYPTLKLRRDYFALMSLFLGEAVMSVLNQFGAVTGGAAGLSGIPKMVGVWGIAGGTVVVIFMVASLKYSRFGRMCLAIKNDELAAKSFGIQVFRVKMKVYVLSSMIAGFSGVLYAFYLQFIDPNMFGWTRSSELVIFLFFGGSNSLTGSILSSIVLTALPELLRFASELRTVIYTLIIILTLNFRPQGIMGEHELSLRWMKTRITNRLDRQKPEYTVKGS